jgi:hypothetical protein
MTTRFRLALVSLVLAAIAGSAAWTYFSKRAFADSDDDRDKQSAQRTSHVSAEGGKTVLKFSKADQQANGITVVTLNSSQQRLAVQGTGTILQIQPFLDLKTSFNTAQMDLAKARAAVQASHTEYSRLVKLNQDGVNASAKSVEASKATAESDAPSLRNAEQSIVLLKDSSDCAGMVKLPNGLNRIPCSSTPYSQGENFFSRSRLQEPQSGRNRPPKSWLGFRTVRAYRHIFGQHWRRWIHVSRHPISFTGLRPTQVSFRAAISQFSFPLVRRSKESSYRTARWSGGKDAHGATSNSLRESSFDRKSTPQIPSPMAGS